MDDIMSRNHHPHRGGVRPSKFGGNFIDPFEEIFIDPLKAGGFEVKEEEGKVVVVVKGIFQVREEDAAAAAGNPPPINNNNNNNNNNTIRHLNLSSLSPSDSSSLPMLPTIQRDLGRLNLSSSYDSSSRPPQLHFPWVDMAMGTDGCTKILPIDEIALKLGITEIRGEVECSKCHQTSTIGFNLQSEFEEIAEEIIYYNYVNYYGYNLNGLHCPDEWLHPKLPPCPNCCLDADQVQPNSPSSCYLKPVIPENNCDYDRINWLFLFLGQMLGCCTVEQLNFFCKHSTSDYHHRRTGGAKDRLLYLTYLTLCKQLLPTGQFDSPFPS